MTAGAGPGSGLRVLVGSAVGAASAGIHAFDLDVDDSPPVLVERDRLAGVDRPTFLVAHPSEPVLYAVSEIDDGQIVEILTDASSRALRVGRRVPSHGSAPCHLDTDGERVYVANYGSGSAAAYAVRADGRLGDLVWTARHDGAGPHARQDAPHAHCVAVDPRRAAVHVVDLGTDRVETSTIDPDGRTLRPGSRLTVTAGAGPRHLAFHPTRPLAYLVCELDCTLVALEVLEPSGGLRVLDVVPTLPTGAPRSLAAAVRVDSHGHRVYVSNRGHDSIATFATDHPGAPLVPLGWVASGGRTPRDLVLDPSGRTMLVANQDSDTITGFAIDADGVPRPVGTLAEVPRPTCVHVAAAHGTTGHGARDVDDSEEQHGDSDRGGT